MAEAILHFLVTDENLKDSLFNMVTPDFRTSATPDEQLSRAEFATKIESIYTKANIVAPAWLGASS